MVFDAKAEDTVTYNGKTYEAIPRAIRISRHGGRESQSMVLAGKNWRTYHFSFVPELDGSGALRPFLCTFGVGETPGSTWIRNVRLYEGSANRLWRVFENGIVFLNESDDDWILDWSTHFLPHLGGRIVRRLHARRFEDPTVDYKTNIYDGARVLSGTPQIIPPGDARFYRFHSLPR